MRANSSAYPRRAAVGTLKQKAARCYMEITMEITPGSK